LRRRAGQQLVGVIGAGEVTNAYWLPAISAARRRAVVHDVVPERALSTAAGSRIVQAAGSIAELLEAEPDVVVVATPPHTHLAVVRELAGGRSKTGPPAPLRVVLEKPPFLHSTEVDEAAHLARSSGLVLFGAFIRRTFPAIREARTRFPDWLDRLGPPHQVQVWEGRPRVWASRAVRDFGLRGLDHPLHDELAHAFDALFHITALEAYELSCDVSADTPFEYAADVQMRTSSGDVHLSVHCSRTRLLSNRLTVSFGGGEAVAVETLPGGGLAQRHGGAVQVVPVADFIGVRAALDSILLGTDGAAPIDAWRAPLRLTEALAAAR
jgi:predicted dehydrogenase